MKTKSKKLKKKSLGIKSRCIYDEIYKANFVFLLNINKDSEVEDILKTKYSEVFKIYEKEKLKNVFSISDCSGRCIKFQDKNIYVIIIRKLNNKARFNAVLAHECLHATNFVLGEAGVEFIDNGANEPFTYYLEYLIRNALSF